MLYSTQLQVSGWRNEHIHRLEKLLWAHAIRAEEFYGLAICTENLEYSTHAPQDIYRHSSMDNYSCELYERAIMGHKAQKHNAKGLEKTFATRENIRNFLEDYQEKNGPLSEYGAGKTKHSYDLDHLASPILLHETSLSAAKALLQDMENIPNPAVQHAISYGVAIGKMEKKLFPAIVIADINRFFSRNGMAVQNIPNILSSLKSVAIRDDVGDVEKFRIGTTCKISSSTGDEYIMEISHIFQVGPIDDKHFTFVNGKYYIPCLHNGGVICHPWTQTRQLIPREYIRDSIQATCRVKRKVIMYPDPSNLDDPQFYICIDFKNPELVKDVAVPVYPLVGETVHVKGPGNQVWFGLVKEVNYTDRNAMVQWYKETRRRDVWITMNKEDLILFSSIVKTCQTVRVLGGYNIV